MFGFDDDDFGLDDLIEADIQYGLFEDDYQECMPAPIRKDEEFVTGLKRITPKIDNAYKEVMNALNSNLNDRILFQKYKQLVDCQIEAFYIYANKLDKDFIYIQKQVEKLMDISDIQMDFEDGCDYLETCLDSFDDLLSGQFDNLFPKEIELYSNKLEELQKEYDRFEDLKTDIEFMMN